MALLGRGGRSGERRRLDPGALAVTHAAPVCRVWGLARSGVYQRLREAPVIPGQRPGRTLWPDAGRTLGRSDPACALAKPFHGEGYRKVWARLRHA